MKRSLAALLPCFLLALPSAVADPTVLDFEDMDTVAPGNSGYVWMPPGGNPYHDIADMGPNFMAYEVGYESWVRSMDAESWSLVNWGGGNNTRSIEFDEEVDFAGAWFTWGQQWYAGSWVAAKWVEIVGKDAGGATVGATGQLTLDATWQYLTADMDGVKTIEITSFNDEYGTSYYQLDNLEYSAVPEPGTLWLFALGGLAMTKRKTRHAA